MSKTKIEWSDYSWNPITGCSKIGEGCRFCYAERMARRLAGRYGYPEAPNHFDVTLHSSRLEQPLRWRKPRRIFVCSMGDLFHEDVPFAFIAKVFDVMAYSAPHHTYQILTKRPGRMKAFIHAYESWYSESLPGNIWLGVSVENQATADERILLLLQIPAAMRFLSLEPLLGAVDLDFGPQQACIWCGGQGWWVPVGGGRPSVVCQCMTRNRYLNWVIVGGESGPGARPMHPDWVRSVRDQCQVADVPFFFKQWGAWIPQILFPDITPNPDGWGTLDNEGNWFSLTTPWNGRQSDESPEREYVMVRVGKNRAGRLLDGALHEEYPT